MDIVRDGLWLVISHVSHEKKYMSVNGWKFLTFLVYSKLILHYASLNSPCLFEKFLILVQHSFHSLPLTCRSVSANWPLCSDWLPLFHFLSVWLRVDRFSVTFWFETDSRRPELCSTLFVWLPLNVQWQKDTDISLLWNFET